MKSKPSIVLFSAALFGAAILIMNSLGVEKHSFKPAEGYVPDKKTAIRIAEAVLTPIYGEELVRKERPYTATLTNDVWFVEGTLRKGILGAPVSGGVAEVEISKKDGCVLRVSHGK